MESMIEGTVTVKVDRPMGSYHPEHKELYYPVNYGYIEGIMGGDGEEQDAYILGIEEPLESFVGRVIAIIHRLDDVECKLVVAPDGVCFTREEIIAATHFQERFFNIDLEMLD
jgi:inorganic pyrophosphatase